MASDVLEQLVTEFVFKVNELGLQKYERAQKRINKNTKEMIGLNSALSKGLLKIAGVFGVGFGISSIVNTYRNLDLMRRSIEGLTQSTQDWEYIQKEAFRTATDIEVVAKGYRNFYSAATMAGMDKNSVQTMYSNILESGRAVGATQQQIQGALLALEQMFSKGKVSMEELRRQLGNALPGAFEVAAKAMGVTTEKFNELIKKGVQAKDLVPKFTEEYRKTFEKSFPEAMKSLDAAMVNLGNSWKILQYDLMNSGAGKELAKGLVELSKLLQSPGVKIIINAIGKGLAMITKALGFIVKHFRVLLFMFGIRALSKLPVLLNTIKVAIIGVGKAGMAAGKSFLWLTIISTVLYGIYLIIQDIYTYIKHPEWESFTKDLVNRFPGINKAIDYMKSIMKDVKPILKDIMEYGKDILQSFINFEKNTGLFKKGIKGLIIAFLGLGVAIAWVVKMVTALFDKANALHDATSGGLLGGLIGAAGGFAFGGVPGAVVGGIAGIAGGAKFMPKLQDRWKNSPNNSNNPNSPYYLNKAEATTVNNNQRIVINAQNRSDSDIVALLQKALNGEIDTANSLISGSVVEV